MKRFLLLFVILLPLLGISQVDLVQWNGMSVPEPTTSSTPEAISSVGLNLSSQYAGYVISGINNQSSPQSINYNKYIQFKVLAGENAELLLKQFKFSYLINDDYNGAKKIEVRYSTSNFSDNGTLLGNINTIFGSTKLEIFNFPTSYKIIDGQQLSVRIYFYDSLGNADVIVRHYVDNQGNPQGPTLTGSVTYTAPTLLPLVKWTSGNKTSTILSPGVVSESISGVEGITTSGQDNNFFKRVIQYNETALNVSKYIEMVVGVDADFQVKLDKLSLQYRKSEGNGTFQVRFSKDKNNFNSTFTQSVTQSVTSTSYSTLNVDLSTIRLAPNEKLFIRIYPYANNYSELHIKFSEGSKTGPIITGTLGSKDQCLESTTWENGLWSNGQPTKIKRAIIKSNYAVNGSNIGQDLDACDLKVLPGVIITVNENQYLSVKNNVINEGKIIIENNASFVQINETASYIGASDSFIVKRHTQPVRRYDFTYWSSPVKEADWKLNQLSPSTLSDKYYYYDPMLGWKINYGGTMEMQTGRGYCVRAPQTFEINAQAIDTNTKFIGKPNNGNLSFTTGNAGTYNLVGNPYASALSADQFIDANINNITGTLYFWTHNTANTNYKYSPADYAAYNKVGGVATQPAAVGGSKPTGNIASGQGFFVERKASGTNDVVFNNKMRVVGNNKQFYKTTPTEMDQNFYRNRFWVNVSNVDNAFSELLVGYVSGATDGFDNGYDGTTFGGNVISMYSLLGETALAIQGKNLNFENTDVIKLGYTTNVGGQFTINLTDFDGLFASQDIFLKDKSNGTIVNIKETNYTFTTATGTFNDRFEIVFLNNQDNLGTENPTIKENSILVFNTNNQVNVKSNDLLIDTVEIYDLQGRTIFTKNKVNAQTFATQSLSVRSQVVIVKIITDNKAELVKKVILR